MKHAQPRSLSRRRVAQLLLKKDSRCSAGSRIDILSRHFLGQPYTINPLIGSADTPEVFTVSLDGFDCVTYIETILALARASSVDDFSEWLRKIRYEGGRVTWDRRNHYMTNWIRNNARAGTLRPRHLPLAVVVRDPALDRLASARPATAGAAFERAAAEELLAAREEGLAAMRARGVLVLDVPPAGAADAVIEQYTRLKRRGVL